MAETTAFSQLTTSINQHSVRFFFYQRTTPLFIVWNLWWRFVFSSYHASSRHKRNGYCRQFFISMGKRHFLPNGPDSWFLPHSTSACQPSSNELDRGTTSLGHIHYKEMTLHDAFTRRCRCHNALAMRGRCHQDALTIRRWCHHDAFTMRGRRHKDALTMRGQPHHDVLTIRRWRHHAFSMRG